MHARTPPFSFPLLLSSTLIKRKEEGGVEAEGGREGRKEGVERTVSKPKETGMYSFLRSPSMVLGAPITRVGQSWAAKYSAVGGREGGRQRRQV